MFEVLDLSTEETHGAFDTKAAARAYIKEKHIAFYEIIESDMGGDRAEVVEARRSKAPA